MDEILADLSAGSRVLDLGSGAGSFRADAYAALTIRADIERVATHAPGPRVQADAASLPFTSQAFDAVISNHSLEHLPELDAALKEMGRVVKPGGAIYISTPDASTFTDKLYRWLARGGGHVNAFTDAVALAHRVEQSTGLRHVATRPLYTSLSFLNSRNRKAPPPRKLLLLANGNETVLLLLTTALRLSDRLLGTRLSCYGWGMYFGAVDHPVDVEPWRNVCVRCGAGHPQKRLKGQRLLYRCPACGARNIRA